MVLHKVYIYDIAYGIYIYIYIYISMNMKCLFYGQSSLIKSCICKTIGNRKQLTMNKKYIYISYDHVVLIVFYMYVHS